MSQAPFELTVERFIAAPPRTVFHVWKTRTAEWWAPKPWTTKITELDLRAGGRSAMVMTGPDGVGFPSEGVILEVVPDEKIVFTDAFTAGWMPQKAFMLGFFTFAPEGDGTRYRAGARHWSEDAYQQHVAMGFIDGWGKVAGQLAALAEAEAKRAS
jgi:uncharacterized protein YndB with AHSA1/START domain